MEDVSIMIGDVKFNYRVCLIIKKGDEVLVEYNPEFNFTVLPGGRVKTLEKSIDALLRETKEEMNVNLKIDELENKGIIENLFKVDEKNYHELLQLYKMNIKKEDQRFKDGMTNLDSKASYYKWIKIENLEEANLLPDILINIIMKDK